MHLCKAEDFSLCSLDCFFFFFHLENIILGMGDFAMAGFQCCDGGSEGEVASLLWLPDPWKVPCRSCSAGSLATEWWILLLKISRGGLRGGNSQGLIQLLLFCPSHTSTDFYWQLISFIKSLLP